MSLLVLLGVILLLRVWRALWSERVLPKLRAQVEVSRHSLPFGTACTVTITIENASRLPAPLVVCELPLPPGLGLHPPHVPAHTAGGGTPGSRPASAEGPFARSYPERLSLATSLRGRELVAARFTVYGVQRGVQQLGELTLRLADGLTPQRAHRQIPVHRFLTVHPRHIPAAAADAAMQRIGPALTRRKLFATAQDWIDLRPYQPGDPLRDVHFVLSARRGELMVLERPLSIADEWVLVVNVEPSRGAMGGSVRLADAAIECAYAIALRLLRREADVTVYSNALWAGRGQHRVLNARGPLTSAVSHRIGHVLGQLPHIPHVTFDRLLDELIAALPQPVQVVVITPYQDEGTAGRLAALRRRGHEVAVVPVAATAPGPGQDADARSKREEEEARPGNAQDTTRPIRQEVSIR
ncbi:DUF58 domain-containing protein [Alicyclobacillus cellulosilyticus]|nr:DUF58 domain-containing protein [Alicyclobacillus cellulosilyticus]